MRFRQLFRVAGTIALVGACNAAQVQANKVQGVLRESIERDKEEVKRPILSYLDAARVAADRITSEFCAGREDNLVADLEASAKAVGREGDMRKALAVIHGMFGAMTSFEYRNQALEFQEGQTDLRDVKQATTAVFYSVKTSKFPDGNLFLTVKTQRIGSLHRVFQFQFQPYPSDNFPPWLRPRSPTK